MKKEHESYINIKLENFKFFHRATNPNQTDDKYIHRTKQEQTLKNWLQNPDNHGTYLVSGYRGVGKSSLVGAVIGELKREHKHKYIDVCINIGQENIDELNILQIIAKNLRNALIDTVSLSRGGLQRLYHLMYICDTHGYHIILLCIFSILMLYLNVKSGAYVGGDVKRWFDITVYTLSGIAIVCTAVYVVQKLLRMMSQTFHAIDQLEKLCSRFNSKTTYRRSAQSGFEQFQIGSIATEREIQVANIQEIEYELTQILSNYKHRKVVIVLDELDKAEPDDKNDKNGAAPDYEKVSTRPEQHTTSRSRRIRVLSVIANMKFFLSTADAYFVFIAGRELYEASMADLSDRDFSISNIFNGIINVDSFYSHPDIHDAIAYTEEFVCRQIMPRSYLDRLPAGEAVTLSHYHDFRLCSDTQTDRRHLDNEIIFLYHFISYLAFISNGSPKKITMFFERYVRSEEYLQNEGLIERCRLDGKGAYWLSFGYNSQMKINFVHYITYPVVQNIMSRSAILGDKLQVSDSFLLAHIFKLHQGGFSWRNLEHTPEILEINRSPEIRDYIGSLISYLNHTSLTTISCGLYHYKFPLRFAEEISYFSKLSDEFSALFNFSLDELQPIKEHYFKALDYSSRTSGGTGADTYAEASIRHSLGDIYMQEENYSAAIRQFEKCIEIVSPLLSDFSLQYEQYQNYLLFYNRTMLKLGLAHEKRHTDNSAYAIYNDLINSLLNIRRRNPYTKSLFRDNRTMHLGILARLYVLEKLDTTGLLETHILEAVRVFNLLFGITTENYDPNELKENKVNTVVAADFFRKLGDIIYYKNPPKNKPRFRYFSAQYLYYQSLCILLNKSINTEESVVIEYVLSFICKNKSCNMEENKPEYTSQISARMYNLAILFESLGHAYLQDSTELVDPISEYGKELSNIKTWIIYDFSNAKWSKRHFIHKAMLCYWAASKLYGESNERDLASRCYKHLINVLNHYVNTIIPLPANNNSNDIKNILRDLYEIAQLLTRRYIMSQYRQYEHINFAEKTRISRMLKTDDYARIFNYLSLYPNVDEMMCLYQTFLVSCLRYYDMANMSDSLQRHIEEETIAFMHKELQHEGIFNHTISNIIARHRTVSHICRLFAGKLLKDNKQNDASLDLSWHALHDFLDKDTDIPELISRSMEPKVPVPDDPKSNRRYKFDLIMEVLAQGIRSTSYIMQMISPMHNTTLFNHTFRGNIYWDLAYLQMCMDQLCDYCGYNFTVDYSDECRTCQNVDADNSSEYMLCRLHELFSLEYMQRHLRYSNVHYLVENAIHSYAKARQCSMQGQSYQELIRAMYFLDDDLNNDTIQFYIAMERASAEQILKRERNLKKDSSYNKAAYYLMRNYIPDISAAICTIDA